jgi:hypothetical protein
MPNLSTLASWAQIISLLTAIVAILVSVWLYRRSRQRRALACEFDPIVSPIEIRAGEALKGDIEIHYRGQAVKNLFLVRAKLKNVGNVPIRKADVVEPVTFTFGPDVELLRQPQILDKKPENLKVDWDFGETTPSVKPNAVNLKFDLLNPEDELTMEFTCSGNGRVPKVSGRIEGMTEVVPLDPEEKRLRKEVIDGLTPLIVSVIAAFACTAIMLVIVFVLERLSKVTSSLPFSLNAAQLGSFFLSLLVLLVLFSFAAILWSMIGKPAFKLIRYRRRRRKV